MGVTEIPSLLINSRITTYAHVLNSTALKKPQITVIRKVLTIKIPT